jgi:hypothetical protein
LSLEVEIWREEELSQPCAILRRSDGSVVVYQDTDSNCALQVIRVHTGSSGPVTRGPAEDPAAGTGISYHISPPNFLEFIQCQ